MSSAKITKSMFDQLEYDTEYLQKMSLKNTTAAAGNVNAVISTPSVMIVFATSDINAAAYNLAQSLCKPLQANAVVTILLQEAVREDFLAKVQAQLPASNAELANHAGFIKAWQQIESMHLQALTAGGTADGKEAPALVADMTHEQLGGNAVGIVTLHTFRTAKEAIALCSKETVNFTNATIWHVDHACAYELVAALSCKNFFINCYQVAMTPLLAFVESGKSGVIMEKSYHFETLLHNGVQKCVVFPFGTIFAN